jgi:hypothetical protein
MEGKFHASRGRCGNLFQTSKPVQKMEVGDHQRFQKPEDDDWLRLLDKCRP